MRRGDQKLIRENVPVKISLEQGQGAPGRIDGFTARAQWLDLHAGKRTWTWTPGTDDHAVVYHVPESVAMLFKLTWAGL